MSSISFLTDIYTCNIPEKFIKETRNLLCEFLWSGKTWRIAQNSLALRKEHGGLELKDLDNFIECKKIKWLIKIHFSEVSTWNEYGKYCLHKYDVLYNVENFLLQCSNLEGLNWNLPSFYKVCIKAWSNLLKKKEVKSKDDVLNENLFGNFHIKHKQRSIFFSNWLQCNFIKVKDLWNTESNSWLPGEEIYNTLTNKRNWIGEYNKLKSCIPVAWKALLCDNNAIRENLHLNNTKSVFFSHSGLFVKDKQISFKKMKEKEIYYACLYPIKHPSSVEAWSKIFGKIFTVKEIFTYCENPIINKKALDFHYKCLHRATYSEMRLKQMKKSNGKCKLCEIEDETTCHLLAECKLIKPVWTKLQTLLTNVTSYEHLINTENVIFGIRGYEKKAEVNVSLAYNYVIYSAKWCIWKHRNNVKYGNRNSMNTSEIYDTIMSVVKEDISIILETKTAKKCNEECINFLKALLASE